MKYLKNFALYEAKSKNPNEDEIMDAMTNSPAGKDLAAMASSYKVDRTGKLVIAGLRGRTYVKPDPAGSRWIHWVEATGRTYGHGAAPTLEECLRDCWKEFILNSTSFRPQGMKIKEYISQIEPVLSSFEGKALNMNDLQFEITKVIKGDPSWNPIRDPSFIFEYPELREVFDFIGLEKVFGYKKHGGFMIVNYKLLGNNSPLVQILPYDNNMTGNEFGIRLETVPEDVYQFVHSRLQIGGDVSKKQEYKDRYMPDFIAGLNEPEHWSGKPVAQYVIAAGMIEAALGVNSAKVVETIIETIIDLVKDVTKLVQFPEPIKSQVMTKLGYEKEDIDSIFTAKEYGVI